MRLRPTQLITDTQASTWTSQSLLSLLLPLVAQSPTLAHPWFLQVVCPTSTATTWSTMTPTRSSSSTETPASTLMELPHGFQAPTLLTLMEPSMAQLAQQLTPPASISCCQICVLPQLQSQHPLPLTLRTQSLTSRRRSHSMPSLWSLPSVALPTQRRSLISSTLMRLQSLLPPHLRLTKSSHLISNMSPVSSLTLPVKARLARLLPQQHQFTQLQPLP